MRKTSEDFISDIVFENIWELCAEEETVHESPYWETINRYLENLDPEYLQEIVSKLVYRLLRSKAFYVARIWKNARFSRTRAIRGRTPTGPSSRNSLTNIFSKKK